MNEIQQHYREGFLCGLFDLPLRPIYEPIGDGTMPLTHAYQAGYDDGKIFVNHDDGLVLRQGLEKYLKSKYQKRLQQKKGV